MNTASEKTHANCGGMRQTTQQKKKNTREKQTTRMPNGTLSIDFTITMWMNVFKLAVDTLIVLAETFTMNTTLALFHPITNTIDF